MAPDGCEAAGARFDDLVRIMRTLRAPGGCPWDREQTLQSLRPFVLEETYELLDALDRQDLDGLREELGDFLYEAVFLAQIAEEAGHFSIADAVEGIADKLVRRHPHVFTPDGQPLARPPTSPPTRCARSGRTSRPTSAAAKGRHEKSALRGVPVSLPALLRAYELARARRGRRLRLDHAGRRPRQDRRGGARGARGRPPASRPTPSRDEVGDLLFAIANYSRKLGIEPEAALRGGDATSSSSASRAWRNWPAPTAPSSASLSLDAQNALWDRVKAEAAGRAAAPAADVPAR